MGLVLDRVVVVIMLEVILLRWGVMMLYLILVFFRVFCSVFILVVFILLVMSMVILWFLVFLGWFFFWFRFLVFCSLFEVVVGEMVVVSSVVLEVLFCWLLGLVLFVEGNFLLRFLVICVVSILLIFVRCLSICICMLWVLYLFSLKCSDLVMCFFFIGFIEF